MCQCVVDIYNNSFIDPCIFFYRYGYHHDLNSIPTRLSIYIYIYIYIYIHIYIYIYISEELTFYLHIHRYISYAVFFLKKKTIYTLIFPPLTPPFYIDISAYRHTSPLIPSTSSITLYHISYLVIYLVYLSL